MTVFVFDLDGVIAEENPKRLQSLALDRGLWEVYYWELTPVLGVVDAIRKLRDEGHYVVIYTSRRESDRNVTERWLESYGIPYDELVMNKPRGQVYVDDRGYRFEGWDKFESDFRVLGFEEDIPDDREG